MHRAAAKLAKIRDVRSARVGQPRSGPSGRFTTENAALFRLFFERNPDGVFFLNRAGRFTVANPACEILSGYRVAELLEKTFIDLCAPDLLADTKMSFRRCMAVNADDCIVTAFICKDGGRLSCAFSEPMRTNGKFRRSAVG